MKKFIYVISLLGLVAIPSLKAEDDHQEPVDHYNTYGRDRDAIPGNGPEESANENYAFYPNGRDN